MPNGEVRRRTRKPRSGRTVPEAATADVPDPEAQAGDAFPSVGDADEGSIHTATSDDLNEAHPATELPVTEPAIEALTAEPPTAEAADGPASAHDVPEVGAVPAAALIPAPILPPPPLAPPRPKIGDTRPAPTGQPDDGGGPPAPDEAPTSRSGRRRRRRGRNRSNRDAGTAQQSSVSPVDALLLDDEPLELDEKSLELRRGRERKGRPVGRYQMTVHVRDGVTHIAILEGRNLIEHYVSRPSDDVSQIHGNIYLGRVQNVLPGMEAAFIDIGTPKNAVLYRGDVSFDRDDVDEVDGEGAPPPQQPDRRGRRGRRRRLDPDAPRIEDLLKPGQEILCQVTKNPIGHKGARLTTEVSLPGRFVVLVPDSGTTGISKRLPDSERRRLRQILSRVRPPEHGIIVRTAAEDVTEAEVARDVERLTRQWQEITALARSTRSPALLMREPDMAVRVIREEFNKDYRGVVIDDRELYEQVKRYMESVTPALADRVQFHDPEVEHISLFERYHVTEQLRKAVDRKVWLPSGGSLIIERTEALTVIDVNTGKNVGKSSLEETVFRNNLEAAEEIARQLRLRDIGGIIVIDFIDMEVEQNRKEVARAFRDALARDKTRTQVSDISELGLAEMTRKRIGEGLVESVSHVCEVCEGRGVVLTSPILDD